MNRLDIVVNHRIGVFQADVKMTPGIFRDFNSLINMSTVKVARSMHYIPTQDQVPLPGGTS